MRKNALLFTGIVLWLLLSLLCFSCHRGPIQDQLTARAVSALQADGIELENVSFDGRIAVLSGTIGSTSLSDRAAALVAAQPGVFRVRNNLTTVGAAAAPEPEPANAARPSFEVRFDDQGVVLNGTVPDEATRQALVNAAAARVGASNVQNSLRVDGTLTAPAWLGQVQNLLPMVADSISNGALAVNAGRLALTGTVGQQSTKDYSSSEATRLLGPNVTIDNQIRVSAAQQSLNRLLEGRVVEFVTDRAELTPDSRRLLDEMAAVLRQYPDANISIDGHTDSRGRDAYNLELSQRRANAIRSYLTGLGIAAERLTATGYGETRPIRTNDTPAGRAANRRVEFHVQN